MIPHDSRAAILESLRAGCALDAAAKAVRTTAAKVRAEADDDDDFADALAAAEAEGGWLRATEASDRASAAEHEARAPKQGPIATVRNVDGDGPLDWEAIERAAAPLAPGPLGYLLWLDAKLVAHGLHPLSPWWKQTFGDFYASQKTWLLVCAGRGSGKSTTLTREAVASGMFEARIVPPGERWSWPFISVSTGDARSRIVQIQSMLGAIGIAVSISYPQGKPTIDLCDARGNPISFVSIAATIAGVSGPTTIGVTLDEEAKMRDNRERHSNPASEIIGSLVQTFRARPGIRAIRCSSAWTHHGSHAMSIAEGDTGETHVAKLGAAFVDMAVQGLLEVAAWEESRSEFKGAKAIRGHASTVNASTTAIPTWVANPTISAMASRKAVDGMPATNLDGLPRGMFWLRENASVPMLAGNAKGTANGAGIFGLADRNAQLVAGMRQRRTDRDGTLLTGHDREPRASHRILVPRKTM